MAALAHWMLERLKEPTTWTGIGLIVMALTAPVFDVEGLAQAIVLILGGGLAAASIERAS